MTFAICLRCGAEKLGALTPCLRCGFEPQSAEENARSILLSDHNMPVEELKTVAQEIQAGKKLTFDEEEVREMASDMGNLDLKKMEGEFRRTCCLVFFVVVAAILGLEWFLFAR